MKAAVITCSNRSASGERADDSGELLAGLRVDTGRMAANLAAAHGVDTEQRAAVELAGHPPAGDGLGAIDLQIDAARERARAWLDGPT